MFGSRRQRLQKARLLELDAWCDLVLAKSWIERMKLWIILDNARVTRRRLER